MGLQRCAWFFAWWHTIMSSLAPANAALAQQVRTLLHPAVPEAVSSV